MTNETYYILQWTTPCCVCGQPAAVGIGDASANTTAPLPMRFYCHNHNPLAQPGNVYVADARRTVPVDDVWAAIERFRATLRGAGRESEDDVVLELMDYLAGWCGPIPGRGVLAASKPEVPRG